MIAAVLCRPKVDVRDFEVHQVDLDVICPFHRIGTEINIIGNAIARVEILKRWGMRTDTRVMEFKVRRVEPLW